MLTSFIKSPRTVGTVTPSSAFLGKAICEKVDQYNSQHVIELGCGSGSITTHILQRLNSPQLLTCIEIDQHLCFRFRQEFPHINLLQKDCCEIADLFANYKISNIISSLPYRSLPKQTTDSIFEQKISLANSDTVISLFSYDFIFSKYHKRYPIKLIDSKSVLLNFPPAKVYHYTI